ncbi:MAG: TetR/AcrR family transcriptional regulator [Gammaproteobacteria bacterium]|nr:TetR/AcrR family transcriptional regulator [Gammaproteobacteria bacterium]
MIHTAQKESDCEVRQQILNAALERFSIYGYGKTTMAELAGDSSMSAANLYRYFDNKQDIAAACAQRCMDEHGAMLRDLVRKSGVSAGEKLNFFALASLHANYEAFAHNQKINELVDLVITKRPDLIHNKIHLMEGLVAEIITQGNLEGDFTVDDVTSMATTIYSALKLFQMPNCMSLYDLEHFEKMAGDVVGLLLKGLERR